MEDRTRSHVDAVLAAARLIIDAPSRRLLTQRVFEALKYNALQSARMAAGDFRPDPEAGRFPAAEKPLFKPPPKTFSDLFDEYALVNGKFGKRREKTLSRYRSIFTQKFANFIKGHCKHEDPLRVTRPDAAAWRNALKTEGLSDKTITDVMLACVRAIYARQIDDGYLEKNPADLRMPKPDNGGEEGSERPKGLTDAEAEAILKAARSFQPGKHGKAQTTAIRWVPLITAATGARVTEICQARKEDFEQNADGWTLRITPEAGGVKNNRYRIVPLHSGLIALGLENFRANAPAGPLFYNPPAPGEVSLASAQATGGKIAGWVRNDVGVTDRRVAPNHGWRHRLSTLCRLAGVHPEYREFLAGRAKRHQGEHYGDVAGLRREIERIKTSDMFPGCGL